MSTAVKVLVFWIYLSVVLWVIAYTPLHRHLVWVIVAAVALLVLVLAHAVRQNREPKSTEPSHEQ